ncbi:hypothetical protein VQ03_12975 [Methylobacterium tarhaniae]|uniref:Metallopeptidase DUF4344 n=1 Tax=Methylobacterium tarhaniae TaxID=1187852 RepID=A0A0J6T1K6_9HYPH|nr:DUF4344 domain-containing metallopeptidase [Methylobacterium tarhaniae]KMO41330.1 hypothetical protein VQ03_12975 [Methylobacterium tarhaniae]
MRRLVGLVAALSLAVVAPARAVQVRSVQVPSVQVREAGIRIAYDRPAEPAARAVYRDLKRRRVLEGLRTAIGGVRLPRTLTLRLSACGGDANAWYDPRTQTITVCYGYVISVIEAQARVPAKPPQPGAPRRDAVAGPVAQVFLHEAGHALFDLLDVPVLGREEDAADQFAALVLLELPPAEARYAIDGITRLLLGQAAEEDADILLADDHSLALQRLANLLCLAYGADRRAFGDLVGSRALPAFRAARCAAEYGLAAASLARLFRRHLRSGATERTRIRRAFRWMFRP